MQPWSLCYGFDESVCEWPQVSPVAGESPAALRLQLLSARLRDGISAVFQVLLGAFYLPTSEVGGGLSGAKKRPTPFVVADRIKTHREEIYTEETP